MKYLRDFELFKDYFYVTADHFAKLLDQYQQPDRIPGYAGKKSIVIDAASDPWPLDWVKQQVQRCNSSGVISAILVNDKKFADQNQELNFRFFPVWAYRYAQQAQEFLGHDYFSQSRSIRVSFLNRMPKRHRIYAYYLLAQLPWHSDIFLSFYGLYRNKANSNFSGLSQERLSGDDSGMSVDMMGEHLESEMTNFFAKEIHKFPIVSQAVSQAGYNWKDCYESDSPAYTDCFGNLCTETSVDMFCPTEKTFKCIHAGTLIFPISSSGFVSSLKNIGLDIDYTGLNLSSIDSIPDWELRTIATINLLDQLYYNLDDIWHANREHLQYNHQVLRSKQVDGILLKNIQDHL